MVRPYSARSTDRICRKVSVRFGHALGWLTGGSSRHTSPGYGVRHQITMRRVASGSHARSHQRLLPSTAPSRASTDQRAVSSSSRRAARRAGASRPHTRPPRTATLDQRQVVNSAGEPLVACARQGAVGSGSEGAVRWMAWRPGPSLGRARLLNSGQRRPMTPTQAQRGTARTSEYAGRQLLGQDPGQEEGFRDGDPRAIGLIGRR